MYKSTITPEELEQLPVAEFPGEITVIDAIDEKNHRSLDNLGLNHKNATLIYLITLRIIKRIVQ